MNSRGIDDQSLIKQYLDMAIQLQASDIHLVSDHPPIFRLQGKLTPAQMPPLETDQLEEVLFGMLSESQQTVFLENPDIDVSFKVGREYYCRVNMHREKGRCAATIRILPGVLRTAGELGIPQVVTDLARKISGLVLLVGRAGSGKTTTMTHMVETINQERPAKIITVEDPIEYVYDSKRSLIIQREVGNDTPSFATGLKYALRQDPDIVVIGEMRDLDSIAMALTTAETGHLVFGTLHAPDAIEAINRIIDVYPGDKQNQIRVQLADNLAAVVGQQLILGKEGSRVLATELVVSTLAIRNMIRRNSLAEIRSQMESGREGMYTIEQCLSNLFRKQVISEEVALSHAKYPRLLELD